MMRVRKSRGWCAPSGQGFDDTCDDRRQSQNADDQKEWADHVDHAYLRRAPATSS